LVHGIAASYVLKDLYEHAIPYFECAMGIRIRILGFEHPDTQAIVQQYSMVSHYIQQNKVVTRKPSRKKRGKRFSRK